MINYFHRSLPGASRKVAPLYTLVVELNQKKSKQFHWSEEHEEAIRQVKDDLAKATLLAHPMSDARYTLTTDASDNAIGAVLEQQVGRRKQPLAFFSKTLSTTGKNTRHSTESF